MIFIHSTCFFHRKVFCSCLASLQAWSGIAGFQQAMSIGKGEATAAHNLLSEVDPRITERLMNFVQHLAWQYIAFNQDCNAFHIH